MATVFSLAAQIAAVTHGHGDGVWPVHPMDRIVHRWLAGQNLHVASETVIQTWSPQRRCSNYCTRYAGCLGIGPEPADFQPGCLPQTGARRKGTRDIGHWLVCSPAGNNVCRSAGSESQCDGTVILWAALTGQTYEAGHGMSRLSNACVLGLDVLQPFFHLIADCIEHIPE